MNEAAWRALGASSSVIAYGALCTAIYVRERRRKAAAVRAAAALSADSHDEPPTLVVFASQTGQAEAIAWQTAKQLRAAGTPVRVMELNALDAATLGTAGRALFIASTYGEGDAPDGASVFCEQVMGSPPALGSLRYAVLALGDRQYANFCGFGRALDEWLHAAGAAREFERIEVDNSDPGALAEWQARWGSSDAVATAEEPDNAFAQWRLASRELLNPGSAGAPVFHLGFVPQAGPMPHWSSGDLAQVAIASDPTHPRDYSISSLHSDGELQLLVRQEQHPDGTLGAASGLLTSTLTVGDTVAMRLRPHRGFRLDGNEARPLILIGNGTGLAGLRAHLRARAAAGRHDNWLIFGERQQAHDFLCRQEIEAWQAQGMLRRLDMVFSRDQPERFYVQHRLLQSADTLLQWLRDGAAIYVCGSLKGMASGVDAALRQIAGEDLVRELSASGRYRRDVY
ncbi:MULTISPECIES: sulfite reductase subunit alpha [Variovorax]|uniref:sulfite reductase subunit alpha n=1 Tax=Variovorax TaxID=34072 RepID=UPI00086F8AF7|nr:MULTISPECIES: sulfite reductase subunit alpha [Variovorax]MBN8753464.1 flavodoxin domain-containing protein [Variovorax sp.]ODU15748.1 MAG: oxidoreductase [Variovorax sp. SCN 67-85]ODV27578.1 MAG: oxidoreductase [Variovorax sp. SCN 67-20]OJZ11463.1 MAG: oxidoreductase [Variovorax sp. 67-131]UKI05891.1 sulfite reductase subunit alpha [Variovorax paradoxus]